MPRAWVALGSNIEDRRAYLAAGLKGLDEPPLRLLAVSKLYETEPMDVPEQPWFLNLVAVIETVLPPLELLHALQAIEARSGKKMLVRRGPRTLDLDLLLYEQQSLRSAELEVPHSKMTEREFVLRPLCDVDAEAVHPLTGRTAAQLLAALPAGGAEVRCLGDWPATTGGA